MKQRAGGIQIWRTVHIAVDQANMLDLGPIKMVQQRKRSTEICAFSRVSYNRLERYVENMRRGMQRTGGAQNAMAMALMLGMLGALKNDDD